MNLFDLVATIRIDTVAYERGIETASEQAKSFAASLKSGFKSAASDGASSMSSIAGATGEFIDAVENATGKSSSFFDLLKANLASEVILSGVKALSSAVVDLGKSAIQGYAEQEQLIGGVETLFGTGGKSLEEYAASVGKSVDEASAEYERLLETQERVIGRSLTAYQTAGMSANDYMETVTNFSASLIQSLDGDTRAAADYADQAIRDMSDNANKMGTDISMIQNAYQGFAKQNYTMLDNLKLGYGGTQQEMYRLMKDAEELGATFNSEFYLTTKGQLVADFADITTAIHVIQDEMGITGTTAAEASGTIQGSTAAMKAAWANLATGLADDTADLGLLVEDFVDSATTAAGNLLPRIGTVITQLLDVIESKFPDMLEAGVGLLANVANGIAEHIPDLMMKIPVVVESIVGGFIDAAPQFIDIGKNIILGMWEGIQGLAGWLTERISGFVDGIVDDVKGVLGIHSPSTVFAGIGENMALGLAEGWDSEYKSVGSKIKSGLDFGSSSMDFAASGVGLSSASIVNAAGGTGRGGAGGTFDLVLRSEDGQTFGRWMVPFVRSENRSNPEVISDAV